MKRCISLVVVIISTFWSVAPARAAGLETSEEGSWKELVAGTKRYVACKKPNDYLAQFIQLPEPWIVWSKAESRTVKVKVKAANCYQGQSFPVGDDVTFSATEVNGGEPTFSPSSDTAAQVVIPPGGSIFVAQSKITMPKGPGKFKIKAKWTAGEYMWTKTHETEINFVGAKFEKDDGQSYGWDGHNDPPWVSCEESKSTKVRLVIKPDSAATSSKVKVDSETGSQPTVSPTAPNTTPVSISITAVSGANASPSDAVVAKANGFGNGAVLKYLDDSNTEREAKVRVATYKLRTIDIVIHKTHGGALGAQIVNQMNEIFKQAVVRVQNIDPNHTCLDPTGYSYLDGATVNVDPDNNGAEYHNFYEVCPVLAGYDGGDIYVLQGGSLPVANDFDTIGYHYYWLGGVYFDPFNIVVNQAGDYIVAHELFHNYQTPHDVSSCSGNLMKKSISGTHLDKYQWDLVTRP